LDVEEREGEGGRDTYIWVDLDSTVILVARRRNIPSKRIRHSAKYLELKLKLESNTAAPS
jgi:hypothetical protein